MQDGPAVCRSSPQASRESCAVGAKVGLSQSLPALYIFCNHVSVSSRSGLSHTVECLRPCMHSSSEVTLF